MQLDHVGRTLAVRCECATQGSAGGPVAPQHVLLATRKKTACQKRRLALRETPLCVGGVRTREPSCAVSPAEQTPRHDADPQALCEQAQNEVVVLGPAHVAKAEF